LNDGRPAGDPGIDPELWRTFQLLKLGLRPCDTDDMSAVDLDYLLEIHAVMEAR
jgi:hypothetical protein